MVRVRWKMKRMQAISTLATCGMTTIVVGSTAACDLFTSPETRLELARVDTAESPPAVPATAEVGVPFEVVIPVSVGCAELGPVEVEEYPVGPLLEPYVRVRLDPDVLCPGAIRFESHVVEVTWHDEWDFEVTIYAVDVWSGGPVLLRYPVEVRPD